jgi:tripartite-type tricarboxylate transporter receptor subunit TctC
MISRRAALTGLAAALAGSRRARANRRLTVLVGAPVNSRLDDMARGVMPFIGRVWPGTEVAISNIPGAGGLNAMNALAKASPSGATLGWVGSPSIAARIVDRGGDGLLQRLTLLGAVLREPIAFVSPESAPVDSVQDIIRRAGDDADAIPLGTPPPGSPPHLAALRLQRVAQTRLNIVTFPSAAAARQAVLSGNVSAAVLGLSDVIAALRDGRLHGIGLASRNRFGMLPDMPVLSEAGVPLSAHIRRGLAAPAGLPEDVAQRLAGVLKSVTEDPGFRAHADIAGFMASWVDGPSWARQMEAERAELAEMWRTDPWLPSSSG